MGKRKASKANKLPKAFHDDGLADIIEWIDGEVFAAKSEPRSNSVKSKTKPGTNKNSRSKLDDEPSSDEEISGDSSDDVSTEERPTKKAKRTNLYGDELDDSGKVIYENRAHPKLDMTDPDQIEVGDQLLRKVRGLINRLACQNIMWISGQLDLLYKTNKRIAVNEAIFRAIDLAGIHINYLYPRELVAGLMLLVTYLGERNGHEFGASFLHRVIVKFDKLLSTNVDQDDQESKTLDNLISCLVNLYTINLIDSRFVFSVLDQLCIHFNEKSIELILLILRTVGFQLRKDDPLKMKETIMIVQQRSRALGKSGLDGGCRVEFMIEALTAIKNNNVTKLSNYGCDIDKAVIEATMKNLIKRPHLADSLTFSSYQDVLASSKWHVLETRVNVRDSQQSTGPVSEKSSIDKNRQNEKLNMIDDAKLNIDQKLCKALKLNTPTRRAVFNALVKASDHIEATNTILAFGVKVASEAMMVCVHVAIHEKVYNPFYYHLLNAFCKLDRKYKMATRFAIQDKIRDLKSMNKNEARTQVFAKLTFELIKTDAIPITILKAVEWSDIDKAHADFLNLLLGDIMSLPNDDIKKIFSKVNKKDSFASAISLFIKCFLDKNVTRKVLFR